MRGPEGVDMLRSAAIAPLRIGATPALPFAGLVENEKPVRRHLVGGFQRESRCVGDGLEVIELEACASGEGTWLGLRCRRRRGASLSEADPRPLFACIVSSARRGG